MVKPVYSLNQIYNQLNSGTIWAGDTISYSMTGLARTNGADPTQANAITGMSATEQAYATRAFGLWDDLIAQSLVSSNDRNADIAFNYTTDSSASANGVTFNYNTFSNIWFTNNAEYTNDASFIGFGSHAQNNYMHEIGHALGLNHPGPYNSLSGTPTYAANAVYAQDTEQYTIMSYFKVDEAGVDNVVDHRDVNGNYIFPQTPMLHDILAIQTMYGADLTTRAGDTVYGFHSTANRAEFNFSINKLPVLTIYDAAGTDWLDASGFNGNQTIDLHAGSYSSLGNKTATEDTELGNNVAIAYGVDIENATGGSGNDSITGNDGDNALYGLSGDDTLIGMGGADRLYGEEGRDTLEGGYGYVDSLYGGAGDDTYIVNDFDNIYESSGGGHDTVISSIRWVLSNTDELEDLVLTGTDNINGFGNALDNTLTGNSGNNYLDGGVGYDSLAGGAGNDIYSLASTVSINGANTWDKVTEIAGGGIDTVYASADAGRYTYQLEANVENLLATGVSAFRLWGNELDNSLTGNNAANELLGFDGRDTLNGMGGFDTMAGGLGSDTYILDDLTAPNQFGNFTFDAVVEAAGEGIDTVLVRSLADPNKISTNHYTLGANVENGTITGADVFNLTGNELANVLTGNAAANTLIGYDGSDTLIGNGGVDTLIGGAGDDYYYLGDLNRTQVFSISSYDSVSEGVGGGNDTVRITAIDNPDTFTSVETYTLGANVENGFIDGTLAFNLNGNELDNFLVGNDADNKLLGNDGNDTLFGNAGSDTLNGGLGADQMNGGYGNDFYFVDDAGDLPFEFTNEGTDTVFSSITHTLAANIEYLSLQGSADINGTGNTLSNVLIGNDGNNTLSGGRGADGMTGGIGNDVLDGGMGRDVLAGGLGKDSFVFKTALSAATNVDRIGDFSVADDTIRIDNAIAAGLGAKTGVLTASAFFIGVAAHDANDHIIYNSATGALYYDSNGNAAGGSVQIATLATHLGLTHSDFLVI